MNFSKKIVGIVQEIATDNYIPDGKIRIIEQTEVNKPLADFDINKAFFENHETQEEILPNIFLAKTPDGKFIQTSILTLSIKFHLTHGLKYLPDYLIINEKMFDSKNGVNYGNFEFLVFLNYYVKQYILNKTLTPAEKRTHIVCSQNVKERIETIWQESYFGPTLKDMLKSGLDKSFAEQLSKELNYFAEKDQNTKEILPISEFIEFHTFDNETNTAVLSDTLKIVAANKKDGTYNLLHNDLRFDTLSETAKYKPALLNPEFNSHVVEPQMFATTILGDGNGFTAEQETMSMIHWQNFRATMIDGSEFPYHSFARFCIDYQDIARFFLSHCHADHMSFIYWAIVNYFYTGKKVELWTTQLIFDSMLRILEAVTRLPQSKLKKIINFCPIEVGKRYELPEGGTVEVDYSLHSIPALKVKFSLKSAMRGPNGEIILDPNHKPIFKTHVISYSGDTLYNPDRTDKMVKDGYISSGRKDAVDDFVFDGDLIFYEMGGPPLHTEIKTYKEFVTEDIFNRTYGYHTNIKNVPGDMNFAKAGTTIGLLNNPIRSQEERVLIMLENSPYFKNIPIEAKMLIAKTCEIRPFKKGERIVTQGEVGNTIYIIEKGFLDVYLKGVGPNVERMHKGDTFGEAALVKNPRRASVFAQTDGSLVSIDADILKNILPSSIIKELIESQINIRPFLDAHTLFKALPFGLRQIIAKEAVKKAYKNGATIIDAGQRGSSFAILETGEIEVEIPVNDENKNIITYKKVADLKEKEIFGERSLLLSEATNARLVAKTDVTVYMLAAEIFYQLMEDYPVFATYMTRKVNRRDKTNKDLMENISYDEDEN